MGRFHAPFTFMQIIVILNEVKNLNTPTLCIQILRY